MADPGLDVQHSGGQFGAVLDAQLSMCLADAVA